MTNKIIETKRCAHLSHFVTQGQQTPVQLQIRISHRDQTGVLGGAESWDACGADGCRSRLPLTSRVSAKCSCPPPAPPSIMQTHYRESQQALGVGGKDSPGVAVSLMIFSCVHEAVLSRGTVGRSQGLQPGRLELRSQLELTSCATSNMQMNLSVLSSSTENQG